MTAQTNTITVTREDPPAETQEQRRVRAFRNHYLKPSRATQWYLEDYGFASGEEYLTCYGIPLEEDEKVSKENDSPN